MLYPVLGRARSGKTEFIRNLIADFIRVGRENLILLVPEQFSYERKGNAEPSGSRQNAEP